MKKIIILIVMTFLSFNKLIGQKVYFTKHPIYLDLINEYIYVFDKKDSSIITNYGDWPTSLIKIFNITYKGKMSFIYKDTALKCITIGQYKATTKLSNPDGKSYNGFGSGGTSSYNYRPFRNGFWYYYNYKGVIINIKKYKNGVILKD